MKILVISQFFYPDITAAAYRVSETCDLLRRFKHDVVVVTTNPHKGEKIDLNSTKSDSWVIRVPIVPYKGRGLFDYLIHYVSFLVMGILYGYFRTKGWRPDVIWATTPPLSVGLLGASLSRLLRAPLILDVRDVWPDSAVAAGMLREGAHPYKFAKRLETFLYEDARCITCVSKPMKSYIREWSGTTEVVVIYNGASFDSFVKLDKERIIKKQIIYAGNLGRVQGLDTLLRAFHLLIKENVDHGRDLVLIGDGVLRKEIERESVVLGISDRVQFIDSIPKNILVTRLEESEILFIGLDKHSSLELTIPSKVFDYMAIGRPIVAALAGEGREILGLCGENYLASPGDVVAIKNGLKWQIEKSGAPVYVNCNIDLVKRRFTREHSTRVLENLFHEVVT